MRRQVNLNAAAAADVDTLVGFRFPDVAAAAASATGEMLPDSACVCVPTRMPACLTNNQLPSVLFASQVRPPGRCQSSRCTCAAVSPKSGCALPLLACAVMCLQCGGAAAWPTKCVRHTNSAFDDRVVQRSFPAADAARPLDLTVTVHRWRLA